MLQNSCSHKTRALLPPRKQLSFAFQLRRSSIDNPLYTRKGSDFLLGLTFTLPYSWFDGNNYKGMDSAS